jgi:hypothetical protein
MSRHQTYGSTSYDVYTVYQNEKHYRWCVENQEESLADRILIAFLFVFCVVGSIFLGGVL